MYLHLQNPLIAIPKFNVWLTNWVRLCVQQGLGIWGVLLEFCLLHLGWKPGMAGHSVSKFRKGQTLVIHLSTSLLTLLHRSVHDRFFLGKMHCCGWQGSWPQWHVALGQQGLVAETVSTESDKPGFKFYLTSFCDLSLDTQTLWVSYIFFFYKIDIATIRS